MLCPLLRFRPGLKWSCCLGGNTLTRGSPRLFSPRRDFRVDREPRVSPSGTHVAFPDYPTLEGDRGSVVVVMAELEKNPLPKPKRPAYPNYHKKAGAAR